MPVPQVAVVHVLPAGKGCAVALTRSRTCAADRPGATASISATVPLTSGAAKLVPLRKVAESASGVVGPRSMSVRKPLEPPPPGAARSMRGP